MTPTLTIVCATQGEPRMWPLLSAQWALAQSCAVSYTVVAHGSPALDRILESPIRPDGIWCIHDDQIHEAVQSVVDAAASDYVLILDDDESVTPELAGWLSEGAYAASETWLLARAWLWQDRNHHLLSSPHWPDYQLRLGRKECVVVPTKIHGGWIARTQKPAMAPTACAIEHYKLLLRSRQEREQTVRHYEDVQVGAGFPQQYLPEDRQLLVGHWGEPA